MEVVETRAALEQLPHDQWCPAFREDLRRLGNRAELAVTPFHGDLHDRYGLDASTFRSPVQFYDWTPPSTALASAVAATCIPLAPGCWHIAGNLRRTVVGKFSHLISGRRSFLRFAASGVAIPLGAMAPARLRTDRSLLLDTLDHPPICRAAAQAPAIAPGATPRELKITWNTNAVCNVGVAVADQLGYFARHNLKVEKINFAGATDQLLELLASGKADAGVGMALAWMKPLEQGFDVKLTAAIHGGCIRLITTHTSGITDVAGLKGKAVGTVSMASPDKNFISILAMKQGIDPNKDIEWRPYPADLLGVALQKGEIQAFSGPDPVVSIIRDRDHLVEVTNNLSGEFAHRACCVLGIRGSLTRDERPVAAAITAALMEAQEWVAENPDGAAAIFAGFTKVATAEQLAPMLRSHTHHHHPMDGDLRQEIALYAQELKGAGVFKSSTDPMQFADRVCLDVLAT
jgi:NitT/TauT family transport system substrate-binding protein